jgi:formylglycine-generating enzyme required for sulfatase activity
MALVSASDGAFYIGRMEVTTTEWRRIMNFGEPTGRRTTPNHPAVSVSLEEILEFLHRTSLRLPTEAEWQNSWRHARRSAPPHPLELVSGNLGNWGRGVPSAGGISEPSAYPVFDLVGNVWEWVRTHSGHGIIGGGFGSGQEDLIDLQVARDWDPEDARVDLGFRVAADP